MALISVTRPVHSVSALSLPELLKTPVEFSQYTANASSAREDLGRVIRMNSGSALTVTLNRSGTNGQSDFFYPGEYLVYTRWGAGSVTFEAGANTLIVSEDSLVAIDTQRTLVAAVYLEDNTWWLLGRLA